MELLIAHGERVGRTFTKRDRRPKDVAPILFRDDAAFAFEHLQPLFAAELEALRHAVNFGVHVLFRDDDIAVAAIMQNETLIHDALEHIFTEAFDTSGGESVAANLLAIYHGHDVSL